MSASPDLAILMQQLQGSAAMPESSASNGLLPNGKKTKGRVKIKMEYIGNKLRRYTTFSKRKTGIMKKAFELSTLTGTQVMLLVASETGHIYTYATKKLEPMIQSEAGKMLIQKCLSSPGEGNDLQPTRTEFTFDNGAPASNGRKRKINEGFETNSGLNFNCFPTMVPNALFSSFNEDDYVNADSGDDSDSEEPSEGKEEAKEMELKKETEEIDMKKEAEDSQALLQQTLKEALREAANNRQQQQKKARLTQNQLNNNNRNGFLAPFLMQGLTSSSPSSNLISQQPILQASQGCLYPVKTEGGANANSIMMNQMKGADEPVNPLLSFPFNFNLQQLMESAALGAQITNSSE